MKEQTRLAACALLGAFVLTLAACGGAQSDGQAGGSGETQEEQPQTEETTARGTDSQQEEEETTGRESSGMHDGEGMDHGGMDHSEMGHGEMDMEAMLMEDGEYSDSRFIDMMVPHHVGAVEMAEVALDGNAEREEIVRLSEEIVRTQNAEIEELRGIKEERFGTSEVPMEMSDEEMGMMGMEMDARELADEEPFDLAFIEQMIPHHQSAIDMAEVALENSEDPQIRRLAEEIIAAQEREISEMESWREEWYPEAA